MLTDSFLLQLQGLVQPSVRYHNLSGVGKARISMVAEAVIQMKREGSLPAQNGNKFIPDAHYLAELQRRVEPAVPFIKLEPMGQLTLARIAKKTLFLEPMFPNETYRPVAERKKQ